ncbi:hypothetical protein BCR39DRAFT_588833 [Naematelia encephala]|uniref:Uncharacterized protein n=1 Tax=Naematelia encephala TaxID=71784 RepID=A0A1Y2AZZ6_9TREE|nr:hypothetical protein BCR39DRAFT_588833 [Naematelia encephala]
MTTAITDQGPLQSYLNDLDETDHSNNDGNSSPQSSSPSERYSPSVNGWTGDISSTAGPSIGTPERQNHTHAEFEERFKYLICSSGILEKDYVPGLGGGDDSNSNSLYPELPTEANQDQGTANPETGITGAIRLVRGRWDVVTAGAVLLLALGKLGDLFFLGISLVAVVAAAFIIYRRWNITTTSATPIPDSPRTSTLNSLVTFLSQSRQLDQTIDRALVLLQPQNATTTPTPTFQPLRVAIHRLTGNMTDHLASATSRLLEIVDKHELTVLGEMYDIPVTGSLYSPRLSQANGDDDEEEDKTAIISASVPSPKRAAFFSPSIKTHDQSPRSYSPSPMTASQSLPGHARSHHLSISVRPQLPGDDRFTLLPSRTPRISKRSSFDAETWSAVRSEGSTSAKRPKHERRITEADEEDADAVEPGVLLEEKPNVIGLGVLPNEDAISVNLGILPQEELLQAARSPFTPRRPSPLSRDRYQDRPVVTPPRTALLDLSLNSTTTWSAPPSPAMTSKQSNSSPAMSTIFPRSSPQSYPSRSLLSSPFPRTHSTSLPSTDSLPVSSTPNARRRSLQSINGHHRQSESFSTPVSSNAKRRSLQNMPYYPSETLADIPGADLSRTPSIPASELQATRSASATGSRRSSTVASPRLDYGVSISTPIANPSIKRISSVSPLTVPGLKASCLGIHLRRRRVACCLLGLRFESVDAYWKEVDQLLKDLEEGVVEELRGLETALKEAEKSFRIVPEQYNAHRSPPWIPSAWASNSSQRVDFAPRSSDEDLLVGHISELRQALVDTWHRLDEAEAELRGASRLDLAWAGVRQEIGKMVRAWERGREAVRRISTAEVPLSEMDQEHPQANETTEGKYPDFISTWQEASATDEDTGSTSLDTDRPSSLEDEEHETVEHDDLGEVLAPPGEDILYEATPQLGPSKTVSKGMSRDERIRLTKQARTKGLTLASMLDVEGSDKAQIDNLRLAGGRVVEELRGMMGLIQMRKTRGGDGWKIASPGMKDVDSTETDEKSDKDDEHVSEKDDEHISEKDDERLREKDVEHVSEKDDEHVSEKDDGHSSEKIVEVVREKDVEHLSERGVRHASAGFQGRDLGFVFPALTTKSAQT